MPTYEIVAIDTCISDYDCLQRDIPALDKRRSPDSEYDTLQCNTPETSKASDTIPVYAKTNKQVLQCDTAAMDKRGSEIPVYAKAVKDENSVSEYDALQRDASEMDKTGDEVPVYAETKKAEYDLSKHDTPQADKIRNALPDYAETSITGSHGSNSNALLHDIFDTDERESDVTPVRAETNIARGNGSLYDAVFHQERIISDVYATVNKKLC